MLVDVPAGCFRHHMQSCSFTSASFDAPILNAGGKAVEHDGRVGDRQTAQEPVT